LFLTLTSPNAVARLSTPQACGIWVGAASSRTKQRTLDTLVIGNEVIGSAAAHVFAMGEHGGTWAFNFAHDGFADTFHHTGLSSYCQVRAEHHCIRLQLTVLQSIAMLLRDVHATGSRKPCKQHARRHQRYTDARR
jgi:hypothetical protein